MAKRKPEPILCPDCGSPMHPTGEILTMDEMNRMIAAGKAKLMEDGSIVFNDAKS